jgi:uncharacterized protein (DUF433 family)
MASTVATEGRRRVMAATHELRFDEPLYTVAEAARFLGVPPSTFSTWAKGYVRHLSGRPPVHGKAIVTSRDAPMNFPTVPFVGLAEGMVIAAFRHAGVSLQHIRRAVSVLENEMSIEHALASRRLYVVGPTLLYDYAEREGEKLRGLTEIVSQQKVFSPAVEAYLKRIEYGSDDWPIRITSPVTRKPVVVVDPDRAFGRPIFVHGAAPVESVVGRLNAGEPVAGVARDFGVPVQDVRDYLGAATPIAA